MLVLLQGLKVLEEELDITELIKAKKDKYIDRAFQAFVLNVIVVTTYFRMFKLLWQSLWCSLESFCKGRHLLFICL